MLYGSNPEAGDAGKFLSEPSESEEPVSFNRSGADFQDHSDRFRLPKDRSFERQYAHIYASRLWNMRSKLEAAAKKKWGKLSNAVIEASVMAVKISGPKYNVCDVRM